MSVEVLFENLLTTGKSGVERRGTSRNSARQSFEKKATENTEARGRAA
jgi:hypothetical protein